MKSKLFNIECEEINQNIYRFDNIYVTFDEADLPMNVFLTLDLALKDIEKYVKQLNGTE